MLIRHNQMIQKVAEKENIPYDQARIVINDFYYQVVMHLQKPENNFIKGIRINDCIKFRLNPKKIMTLYCQLLKGMRYKTKHAYNLVTVHKQLIEHDCYTEKQKAIIKNAERNRLCDTREEGYYPDEEE